MIILKESVKMSVPTPHNEAKMGEIAKKVLMPGDPLRAKFIAENYLEDVKCVNTVRNMLAFTGKYNGEEVTVMGSGMGMPSIGIYSYELFNFYDVDEIIRIGSAGAFSEKLDLGDVLIAQAASTDSNYVNQFNTPGQFAPVADFDLLLRAVESAKKQNLKVAVGNVLSSDFFYNAVDDVNDRWKRMGVLGVEMEAAALYTNAAYAGKKALGIFTVSDHLYKGGALTPEERQLGFNNMIKIALEI